MLIRIKVETKQLLFDMLRRINVIEIEALSTWYVKKDKYGWKWRNNLLICWEG